MVHINDKEFDSAKKYGNRYLKSVDKLKTIDNEIYESIRPYESELCSQLSILYYNNYDDVYAHNLIERAFVAHEKTDCTQPVYWQFVFAIIEFHQIFDMNKYINKWIRLAVCYPQKIFIHSDNFEKLRKIQNENELLKF